MKRLIPAIAATVILTSCAVQRKPNYVVAPGVATSEDKGAGDTRTKAVEMIDNYTYRLADVTTDASYGYTKENPVKVGGASESSGPLNERRFLNGLTGPNGEKVEYYREGSCCAFKSPNGFMGSGLLDRYKVYYRGGKDTVTIFINMYDKGDLYVPVGFKAKQ